MNVYDIGVDFILLDAFDDLESPPSAFLSVLKNRWITTGMKRSVSGSQNSHCTFHKIFFYSHESLSSKNPANL